MNRFKLIVLLIFSGAIGILFFENKQLLTLKLFCPDASSQACFFSSPELSLATWMGLFAIAGIISSLWGQLLNQATFVKTNTNQSTDREAEVRSSAQTKFSKDKSQSSRFSPPKRSPQKPPARNQATTDWEEKSSDNWEENNSTNKVDYPPIDRDSRTKEAKTQSSSSQPKSEPKSNPVSSDSVYSFKFAESSKSKPQGESQNKKDYGKADDVYDANYRTLNNPSSKKVTSQEEDDEEWI